MKGDVNISPAPTGLHLVCSLLYNVQCTYTFLKQVRPQEPPAGGFLASEPEANSTTTNTNTSRLIIAVDFSLSEIVYSLLLCYALSLPRAYIRRAY